MDLSERSSLSKDRFTFTSLAIAYAGGAVTIIVLGIIIHCIRKSKGKKPEHV